MVTVSGFRALKLELASFSIAGSINKEEEEEDEHSKIRTDAREISSPTSLVYDVT